MTPIEWKFIIGFMACPAYLIGGSYWIYLKYKPRPKPKNRNRIKEQLNNVYGR